MKVRVLKKYKDKFTKKIYKAGQEIEVAKERFGEINSTALGPFLEPLEEESKKPTKKKSTKK